MEKVTSFWLNNILYLKEVEKALKYTFKNGVEIKVHLFIVLDLQVEL